VRVVRDREASPETRTKRNIDTDGTTRPVVDREPTSRPPHQWLYPIVDSEWDIVDEREVSP
jgi:hypothetical protein